VTGPAHRQLPDLFLEGVAAHPEAIALRYGQGFLTYRRLASEVRALGRQLQARGVGKGDFVPLLMSGGPASPIGMLAAMSLGAPFVPLYAAWPLERVRATLQQLQPRVVLTDHDAALRSGLHHEVLRVDVTLPTEPEPGGKGTARPACGPTFAEIGDDDLAYGFFTSGSTGTPKCALNLHGGLLNRFRTMTRRFGPGHVVLQNSPHVFDSSLWQLLWPLTSGGTVVQPDHEGLNLLRTIETISTYGVTMTDFVPSVFGTLVEVLRADPDLAADLTSLRYLLIGGEEINPKAVRRFLGLVPQVRVINTYGPTEASIGFVFHEVTDADGDEIPLGTPIDNTAAVVLTDDGVAAHPGEIGEICAGGACLGAGYLNDPQLTAKAFIPNPFPEVPGDRLYRTGDLGYVGSDGLLRFAGRRDHQVKIGGVRVELAEVESAVLSHQAVREAKVVAVGQGPARALVCYVVLDDAERDGRPLTWLGDHVCTLLPAHSVPRRFVAMERLPRTANGKTDRAALADLATHRHAPPAEGNGARVETSRALSDDEHAVAGIWAALLGGSGYGPASDFFAEGGTSLLAYQLSLHLSARFGVDICAQDIATAPALQEQAALALGRGEAPAVSPHTHALIQVDTVLPSNITRRPSSGSRPEPGVYTHQVGVRRVLLTGATGFVGRHLLADLLIHTDAIVYCLIRQVGSTSIDHRLDATLAELASADLLTVRTRGTSRIGRSRVLALQGDLELPRLGLTDERVQDLANNIDTIIHAGAQVNLLAGYQALRSANVGAVTEILRLAASGRPKRIVHLSTLGVLPPRLSRRHPEGPAPAEGLPPDGYSQSKWAAERLLCEGRHRGIPSTVIRIGEATAHSTTGHADQRSVLVILLHACLTLGCRPSTQALTDWTPVDRISRATVRALAADALPDGILHLLAPETVRLSDLLDRLAALAPLREVGYPEFYGALAGQAPGDPTLASLLALLPPPGRDRDGAALASLLRDAGASYSAVHGRRVLTEFSDSPVTGPGQGLSAFLRRVIEEWNARSPLSDGAR
jgi:amino acid adenylation domain-containing protein/thioester reductase-like protein